MSTSFYANAVIGIEIDVEKILPDRLVRNCQCRKNITIDMKYCPGCGKLAWHKEENPIDGLKDYETDKATLFGIPIIFIKGYDPVDRDRYKTMRSYAIATASSHGDVSYDCSPNMVTIDKDIPQMKEELKNKLDPHELWDESKFGLWAIGEMH